MSILTRNLMAYLLILQIGLFTTLSFAEGIVATPSNGSAASALSNSSPISAPVVNSASPNATTSATSFGTSVAATVTTPPTTPQQQTLQPAIESVQNQTQISQTKEAAGETSSIEQIISDGSESEKSSPQRTKLKPLQQFGYSFFRPGSDSFAPLTDIPVGADYIVGTGDRINVTVWGSLEGNYEFEINRNGEIILPKIGPVKVSGTSFGQLTPLIKGQLSKIYKDFQINLTMGKPRLIKVYLIGQVKAPGDYSISSMSTLINALAAAGGPTHNGTLRKIQIRRNGKVIDTVDLYDFFLKGDKSRDIRILSGDTIFVPSIGSVAGIAGNVRRPAIYELKEEKTLQDLLKLADGIIPTGYLQRLQISRVDAHEKKSVTDVNIDPSTSGKSMDSMAENISIKDMDLVKIFPIDSTLRGYVRLDGYVLRPGDYALKPGMKLSDILTQDNLLQEYYRNIGKIVRLTPPDYHPEIIIFNPAEAAAKKAGFDLELQEFDTVQMFSRWEMEEMPTVKINGDVQKPSTYRLFDKMTVRDLIYAAGNIKLTAYTKKAELSRMYRNGDSVTTSTISIDLDKAIKNDTANNLVLNPFDELTVRRIPNWAEETERYVTLTGEVIFPGTYPILRGERLSSIIERAGGFTDKAYLKGAKFTRASVKAQQQAQMEESLRRLEEQINEKQANMSSIASSTEELVSIKTSIEGLKNSLTKLKNMKAEGRIMLHIAEPDILKILPDNIMLEGNDTLHIPMEPATITVLGKVYNQTNPLVREGKNVSYYLQKAGGWTADAESNEIYVIRADGSVESRQQDSWLTSLLGGGLLNKDLKAGDTIVVPPRIEKTAWLRDIKDWTTMLSQLAITAGTVLLGLR